MKTAMTHQAKSFYELECREDPNKKTGVLYIHNLTDCNGQRWSATFENGRFISINKSALNER